MNLECLTFMIKKILLNDVHFREIMVKCRVVEHGTHQHGDTMIKYVYEAILNQTLNHNGNGHDVREATSENQKQLLNDGFESNMTKKGT